MTCTAQAARGITGSVAGSIRIAALAAAALLLSGCVTPATGHDSYADKAVTSVRAATSEVQTARLVLQLLSARGAQSTGRPGRRLPLTLLRGQLSRLGQKPRTSWGR